MSYSHEYEAYEGNEPYAAAAPGSDSTPGRGRRRKAAPDAESESAPYETQRYEPEQYELPSQYEAQPYDPQPQPVDPQWEHSGLGWDQQSWNEQERYGAQPSAARDDADHAPTSVFTPVREQEPPPLPVGAPAPAPAAAATASNAAGRGAFGAAGLAVVTGVGAIAATPVLAVVIGLSQVGLAVGWTRSVGIPNTRRTVALVAGIGLAAALLAYRLIPDRAPAAMGAALGAGFVFLAADQLFRKDTGPGRHRSEALAAAATGAAFTVLPAGYLVAQRWDSALAGACALAAAVAVLCSALVGGGTQPIGVVAAAVAAVSVGTLTAVSLNASAGSKGGALGGLISGLFAVVGARTADRLATEGSDVRISAQALPVAFSAIGAVIAAQVLR